MRCPVALLLLLAACAAPPQLRLEVTDTAPEEGFLRVELELVNGTGAPLTYATFGRTDVGSRLRGQVRTDGAWQDEERTLFFHGPHPWIYSCSRGYRDEELAPGERRALTGFLALEADGARRAGVVIEADGERRVLWSAPFRSGGSRPTARTGGS